MLNLKDDKDFRVLNKIYEINKKKIIDLDKKIEEVANKEGYNSTNYINLNKSKARLKEFIDNYERLSKIMEDIEYAKELLNNEKNEEAKEFYKKELNNLEEEANKIEKVLWELILPEENEKNIIVEIRAGTGGEEAALFAFDLFRMYSKFADKMKFKIEILDQNFTDLGGIKEIVFAVNNKNAYKYFKYESGTHRVQRVPITEASGRIHTSTATVIVLPEVEEREIQIKEEDLEMETFKAGGAGGQHVNKNECAIRLKHIPTGIVVTCSDERSLHQNKAKALRILRAKLLQLQKEKQEEELRKQRRQQVKTGDRSEKIRTYNFPQNRVTDHRINLTIQNLEAILDGDLLPLIQELQKNEAINKIQELLNIQDN
jgi:peptide chain release factor 1